MSPDLSGVVEAFAHLFKDVDDASLDRPWAWRDYDSEGIRFALFRTYEELHELAVRLRALRAEEDMYITSAQRILGEYHSAYRDLHAVCLGIEDNIANKLPAEDDWSIRKTKAHILSGDLGFYVAIRYALGIHRSGAKDNPKIPEQAWDQMLEMNEQDYKELMDSSYQHLHIFHQEFHYKIIKEFADIEQHELDIPSRYWEEEPMSVRFRLHRFSSHMRQHTVQIEKTLDALGHPPSESRRLLRLVFQALAIAENALIGAPALGKELSDQTAKEILERTMEIAELLKT